MQIIDSHCHPQFPQYDEDRDAVVQRARDAYVGMICVGTDMKTSREAVELAEQHEHIWASVGLHPNDTITNNLQLTIYNELLKHQKVVAIGEVGLDYYRTPEQEKQKQQREVFKRFIELAVAHNKPLILHCRDPIKPFKDGHAASASGDMLKILQTTDYGLRTDSRGVAHSFSGTYDEAKRYIEMGFYIGINGIVTFPPLKKNPQAHADLLDAVKNIPLGSLLIETDAPFLAPMPYRGKRNEPVWVVEVAKKIAELRNLKVDEVIATTTTNAKKLFNVI